MSMGHSFVWYAANRPQLLQADEAFNEEQDYTAPHE